MSTSVAQNGAGVSPTGSKPRTELGAVTALAAVLLVIAGLVGLDLGAHGIGVLALGTALGAAFLYFQYGFAGGWRRFLEHRETIPMASNFALAALCAVIIVPAGALGLEASGSVAPLTVSLLIGAFVFGIGMQLANGCASGVLFNFGGGSGRMLIALPFFVIGSVLGSALLPTALDWGALDGVQIGGALSAPLRAGINVLLLGGVAYGLWRYGRARGEKASKRLIVGTVAIAILCIAVFIMIGHPWGITFGFTLWGAKLFQAIGVPVAEWTFWQWAGPQRALAHSILSDTSSLLNIGFLLGAAVAAALAGGLRRNAWPNRRQAFAAVVGGLLMGVGARLAFGCNIGAFLAGTASGSLHGWVWFALALSGSWVGVRLRPHFGF
jgi:uncharacterized membrane protein YedE/YeeE